MKNPPFPSDPDIRMRGFSSRMEAGAFLKLVLGHGVPVGMETVPLAVPTGEGLPRWRGLAGRVLAGDVVAAGDVPSFNRSAMDGYALKGEETFGAGPYNPLSFWVVGEALPGRPFTGRVESGTAVRIMTGAPMPLGADAVLMAEETQVSPGSPERIEAFGSVPPGRNVGLAGEDVRADERVLRQGRLLRPQDGGLLSSLGLGGVDLFLRPRVGLLMSGNEVVPPGGPPLPAGVVDAVSPMLAGLIRRDGGEVAAVAHLPDDRGSQARALAQTPGDILLAVGGTSVGREDHLPTLVADQGRLLVHGVAIRPGSPMGFGLAPDGGGRQRPVFLLPGNPVAALVGYDFFAGPLLRRMGGRPAGWPYSSVEAVLTQRVLGSIGQVDYVRVMIEPRRGALESRRGALESRRGAGAVPWLATPLAHGGAGRLSTTTRADGFVVAGHHSEGWPQGGRAPVWLYDPLPVADAPWIEEEDR